MNCEARSDSSDYQPLSVILVDNLGEEGIARPDIVLIEA